MVNATEENSLTHATKQQMQLTENNNAENVTTYRQMYPGSNSETIKHHKLFLHP